MHEYAIAQHLVNLVETQAKMAKAKRVLAVDISLGEQSHVHSESLSLYFDMLTDAEKSPASGAELRVKRTPMWFYCPTCKLEYTVKTNDFCCPDCSELGQLIDAGDELSLQSIEVKV